MIWSPQAGYGSAATFSSLAASHSATIAVFAFVGAGVAATAALTSCCLIRVLDHTWCEGACGPPRAV